MRQAPGVLTEVAGDKAVLLGADNQELFTLNPVGSVVWELLAEDRSLAELVALVQERFADAPPDVVAEDVAAFVAELREAGLTVDAAS